MALTHAQPLDILDLRPLGAKLTPTRSHSLLRTERLQLMRIVLLAGQGLPPHHLEGEVCLHCLEGLVALSTSAGEKVLQPGDAIVLPPRQQHALNAKQDSSLLVLMLLHPLAA